LLPPATIHFGDEKTNGHTEREQASHDLHLLLRHIAASERSQSDVPVWDFNIPADANASTPHRTP
jgi:hypothetical protein